MKKMKKLTSLILAVLMLISIMGGCGAKANEGNDTDSNEATATETPASDDSSAEVTEVPTVIWYFPSDTQADQDMVWEDLNAKLAEKYNVKIDFRPIPFGEFDDKMKLISTSGEDYDLTFTASWMNNFYDNLGREAFLAIDDLYEAHPELKEQCPEWLSSVAKSNGKLYAIPNMQIVATQLGLTFRKDLVEKYGFDPTTIKTTADIKNLLPAFLDQIVANEPGILVPFYSQQSWGLWGYEQIASGPAYIKKGDTSYNIISQDDFTAFPESKEWSQILFDWAQKNYFGKDVTLISDLGKVQTAGQIAAWLNIYKPGVDASYNAQYPEFEFITVPVGTPYTSTSAGNACMTAINVNSKNPEAAMSALAAIYTDKEIFNELLFGIEGTHYNMVDATHAETVADSTYNLSGSAWVLGNQFNAYFLPGQDENTWTDTAKVNNEAEVSVLRGFTFDPTNVQSQLTQMDAVYKEFINMELLVSDQVEYEKKLADRIDKETKAGINDIVAEVKKQVEAWRAANGK